MGASILSAQIVKQTVRGLLLEMEEKREKIQDDMSGNGLDPFAGVYIATGLGMTWEEWVIHERDRQLAKACTDKLGRMHEELLGSLSDWRRPQQTAGNPDLVCESRKIIVELKNKHNTVKGSDLKGVYENLLSWVNRGMRYEGYVGLYGFIVNKPHSGIPLGPQPFTPSDAVKGQILPADERIKRVSGRTLWAIAADSRPGLPDPPYERPQALFEVLDDLQAEFERQAKHLLGAPPKWLASAFSSALS